VERGRHRIWCVYPPQFLTNALPLFRMSFPYLCSFLFLKAPFRSRDGVFINTLFPRGDFPSTSSGVLLSPCLRLCLLLVTLEDFQSLLSSKVQTVPVRRRYYNKPFSRFLFSGPINVISWFFFFSPPKVFWKEHQTLSLPPKPFPATYRFFFIIFSSSHGRIQACVFSIWTCVGLLRPMVHVYFSLSASWFLSSTPGSDEIQSEGRGVSCSPLLYRPTPASSAFTTCPFFPRG